MHVKMWKKRAENKTAAKFMRNESVKCQARAVFAKSRARHVHIMSLNLLTSHLNYSISRVSYVHSSRITDESLSFRKTKRFRSLCDIRHKTKFILSDFNKICLMSYVLSADFEFQLILYLGPSNFGSEIVPKN